MAAQPIPAVGSHVLISGGKKMGRVTSLITDDVANGVTGFVVHYGWRGKKAKVVPLKYVKWMNPESVVLELSRKHFDELTDWVAPAATAERPAAAAPTEPVQQPIHP